MSVTLYLNADGDLEFDSINRLKMVSGEDKLKQDFQIWLKTLYGEDRFYPVYGLNFFSLEDRESTKKEIQNTLLQIPQVQSVNSLKAAQFDRQLYIIADITLKSGSKITLSAWV